MQTPTAKTPVSKCLDLAAYSARMLGKFPSNAALVDQAAKMTAAAQKLDASQSAYATAVKAILPARADVKFENYRSDKRVRLTQQKAEIADGKKNGPIAAQAFPEGSTTITRLLGASQVSEMEKLEARLEGLAPTWPEAAGEKADITAHRHDYAAAVKGRDDAAKNAGNLRALRNAEKERFITAYVEITKRVEAEFPRDQVTADLFFDDVRGKSSAEEADEEGAPEAEGGAGGGAKPG